MTGKANASANDRRNAGPGAIARGFQSLVEHAGRLLDTLGVQPEPQAIPVRVRSGRRHPRG